nr:MAG TPA_asm: conotoxin [Caudoviricetes sp.]DAN19646.1 MAG TPA: conotoxin [Caudoviricetes sp.]DAZ05626.1 MAG TPA: conotoxin [Caudoviricetes sp.]
MVGKLYLCCCSSFTYHFLISGPGFRRGFSYL